MRDTPEELVVAGVLLGSFQQELDGLLVGPGGEDAAEFAEVHFLAVGTVDFHAAASSLRGGYVSSAGDILLRGYVSSSG